MPLRSVKMKRFIFGFQRRVWCPKWTPLSSSWRMVTTAMVGCSLWSLVVTLDRVAGVLAPGRRPWWTRVKIGTREAAAPRRSRSERAREVDRTRRSPSASVRPRCRARPTPIEPGLRSARLGDALVRGSTTVRRAACRPTIHSTSRRRSGDAQRPGRRRRARPRRGTGRRRQHPGADAAARARTDPSAKSGSPRSGACQHRPAASGSPNMPSSSTRIARTSKTAQERDEHGDTGRRVR